MKSAGASSEMSVNHRNTVLGSQVHQTMHIPATEISPFAFDGSVMANESKPEENHETTLRRLSNEIGEPIVVGDRVVYEEGDRHEIENNESSTEGPPPEADTQPGRTDMTAEVAAEAPENGPDPTTYTDDNNGESDNDDAQPDAGVGGPAGARSDEQVDVDTDASETDEGLAPPVPDSDESGERRQELKDGKSLEDTSGE